MGANSAPVAGAMEADPAVADPGGMPPGVVASLQRVEELEAQPGSTPMSIGCEAEVREDNLAALARHFPAAQGAERLEVVRAFFLPGTLFEGTIAIPGMARQSDNGQSERQKYTLQVLREQVDELGRTVVLARHAAYGDEQACHLDLGVCSANSERTEGGRAPEVCVRWADGETICEGVVEISLSEDSRAPHCVVRGQVKQLLQGEEGFYEPAQQATHTYELFRSTTCTAQAQHTTCLEDARADRIRQICSWIVSQHPLHPRGRRPPMEAPSRPMPALPWEAIVLCDASRQCEERCAELRRQSALLDGLTFETREAKVQRLRELADAGINRASSHAANDKTLGQLKTLLEASLSSLHRDLERLHTACFKAHHRLSEGYMRFDRSLRAAEARLPRSTLSLWQSRTAPSSSIGITCAVCYLNIERGAEDGSGEGCIGLPCRHFFHFDCVSRWLHTHTTCPTCRRQFSDEDADCGEAPKGAGMGEDIAEFAGSGAR